MKKIVIALFSLLSLYLCANTLTCLSKTDQINAFNFMFERNGLTIMNILPSATFDSHETAQLLQAQAIRHQVNLYVTDAEDIFYLEVPFKLQFSLIVGDEAALPAICNDVKQPCELSMLSKDNAVQLMLFDESKVSAYSFYVAGTPQHIDDFTTEMTKQFSKHTVSYSDVGGMKVEFLMLNYVLSFFMDRIVWLITLALLLSSVLYFLTQAKVFAIKRMHGYSLLRIYAAEMLSILKWTAIVTLGCSIGVGGTILISQHYEMSAIGVGICIQLVLAILYVIVYLMLSFPFLYASCHQKIKDILKNKKNTKAAAMMVPFCKVILISICIVQCVSSLYVIQKAMRNISYQEAYASMSEGYTCYSLQHRWNFDTTTGYQNKVFDTFQQQLDAYYIIPQISLSGNKEVSLYQEFGYSINRNYIQDLQLKDEQGKVIKLSNDSTKSYLLVSGSLKNTLQHLPQEDIPVPPDDVIYLKAGQSIFLFDILDKKYEQAKAEDFIIYTSSRLTALDPLYVYIKASPEEMKQALKQAGLPDYLNYEALTTFNQHEVDRWLKTGLASIREFILLLTFMVIFIACDISFYMKNHWRALSVKQFMGYSVCRMHERKLVQEGVLVLLQLGLSYLMIFVFHMNGYYRNDFLITFAFITLINFSMLCIGLVWRNQQSLQESLKQ